MALPPLLHLTDEAPAKTLAELLRRPVNHADEDLTREALDAQRTVAADSLEAAHAMAISARTALRELLEEHECALADDAIEDIEETLETLRRLRGVLRHVPYTAIAQA